MQPSFVFRPSSQSPGRSEANPTLENRPQDVVGASRQERKLELCECMLDIAAALFDVSGRDLRGPGRSTLEVSRVRQIAMYVSHVILGLSMTDIGNGFGRDRTTVMHACHVVEDMRDDDEFDVIVSSFERVASAALRCREDKSR